MKIILINPPYDLIRQAYGSKTRIKYGNQPPLGIGYIASVLLKLGHTVSVVDAPALGYSDDEVIREIIQFGSDAIGISALTASADSAYSLSVKIKKKINTPIIVGGPHSISFPEKSLKDCPAIDISVYSEGELVIRNLIPCMENKADLSKVKGICFRDEKGGVVRTPPEEIIENLDVLPSPAWQLYDLSIYRPLPHQYKALPMAPFVTSRGCFWRKCTYCYQAGRLGSKFRRYSPARVVEEMENLYRDFGVREIMFWDDVFAMSINWIERFCSLLKEKDINIPWSCYGRVDTISRKMLQIMKGAGCWSIFYGYESGNQDLLDKIKKGITLEQSVNATRWAHETGMETRGSFMLALPGETPEKGRKTVQFAVELDPTYAQFLPTHPEYGTELYQQALEEGKMKEDFKYRGRTSASYVPDGYKSGEDVEKMVRYAYRKFYLRLSYIWKHIKKIKNSSDIKTYIDGLRFVFGIIFK